MTAECCSVRFISYKGLFSPRRFRYGAFQFDCNVQLLVLAVSPWLLAGCQQSQHSALSSRSTSLVVFKYAHVVPAACHYTLSFSPSLPLSLSATSTVYIGPVCHHVLGGNSSQTVHRPPAGLHVLHFTPFISSV